MHKEQEALRRSKKARQQQRRKKKKRGKDKDTMSISDEDADEMVAVSTVIDVPDVRKYPYHDILGMLKVFCPFSQWPHSHRLIIYVMKFVYFSHNYGP